MGQGVGPIVGGILGADCYHYRKALHFETTIACYKSRIAYIEGLLMEVITVSSPVTKTVALASALCVSLPLASTLVLQVQGGSSVTKSLTASSRIDLEEV